MGKKINAIFGANTILIWTYVQCMHIYEGSSQTSGL